MALLNRNTGFILGNVLGMTVLVVGIMVTAPQKQAEQDNQDKVSHWRGSLDELSGS